MQKCVSRALTVLLPLGALAVAGCSGGGSSANGGTGGGGGAAVTGLAIADKVSVVDAKANQSPGKVTGKRVLAAVPASSEFITDKTFVYVNDRSIEAFSTPNDILCKVAQTRHAEMVNKGAYKALVDNKLCGDNNGQSQGQAGNAPDYATWTVLATRADANSPEILKVWVHEAHDDGEKIIYGSANITAGASSANPLGLFSFNFAGYPASAGIPTSTQTVFKGALLTEATADNMVSLKFVEQDSGNGGGTSSAALLRSADGSTGSGTLASNSGTMNIAYNAGLFHRVAGADDRCLNRNDFDSSAWRYGLYDSSTGSRIQRNSGFPISFSKNGVSGNGYVGYWGIWQNQGEPLVNGDTVFKQGNNGSADTTPYTVFTAPGKLVKHTRKTLSLADIKGVALSMFSNTNPPGNFRVTWDGSHFVKDAVMMQGGNGQSWQDMAPTNINLATLSTSGLNFYSDSLGGDLQIQLPCEMNSAPQNPASQTFACTASDATSVILYARAVVVPGESVPAALACTNNCPDLAQVATKNPFPYREVGFLPSAPNASLLFNYTFNPATLTLSQGGVPVTTTDAQSYPNGLQSGPLFDPAVADNISNLACTFDHGATCGWQAWGKLAEFYTWETGPQSWQQFSTIKSGSTFLSFQQPLQVLYSHTGEGYNGAKFYLQYNGFGDLQGLPGKCVNSDTGADANCSQQGQNQSIRWVQQFTIAEGSTVTDSSGLSYLVKPLELEQRMKATTGCGALPVSSVATPALSIWSDPGQPVEPVITAAPAVIGGNVQ
jgi:hypothetical protein